MRVEISEKLLFMKMLKKLYPITDLANINGLTIDSRLLKSGDIYFPIKGENVDGHKFINDAVSKGASLIFSENEVDISISNIKIDSSVLELKKLASEWRNYFNQTFIGITGSNGKTTVKELLYSVISSSDSCMKTEGNHNNTIGLPMSLFTLDKSTNYAIIEMGAGSIGEIDYLCDIVKPEIGLITNIYDAHVEYFKNINQIASEKSSLFSALPENGIAFINMDDPFISQMTTNAKRISYGFQDNVDFSGSIKNLDNSVVLQISGVDIILPYGGQAMAQNALSVFAVASTLGISEQNIVTNIENFKAPRGRGEILQKTNFTIIDDTYNANPESTKIGLQAFLKSYPNKRHIAILGDMLELGEFEKKFHSEMGQYISKLSLDAVFGYGSLTAYTIEGINQKNIDKYHFSNKTELIDKLNNFLLPGDVIYIKGSRGMKMESIIEEGFSK
ncbi:MAG: UDP-N-acetylmuramoyl-tripeptide--D-alanyl-D-alanine ligase [Candidatus Marinimicrobia bacterium]|nr:UDP-N-acetylmuramoyl-tripeptide--D-alanyl-D-alanine ligase [Candidatus Neomarinimicrobiota bacterium]MBL7023280.1 UDP-N-acetylmuramoyl-tripeptide--D-alanyl-D-alanine ligase [Candidatus Neomarinimicrobiota bacterium]MBL7108874.1 UDP-N-acetylmuramoyl-tripeptide--D-alanyl-D-alanine ligase [Candidatus Neomarinimicrobiota bacterium]